MRLQLLRFPREAEKVLIILYIGLEQVRNTSLSFGRPSRASGIIT